jgi:hypothetical protein
MLYWFCGGTSPKPPAMGAWPPGPPFGPPPLALGSPASWAPPVAGLLMRATRPLFFILGAHPPTPLGWGCAPSTPALIKVGEGRLFSKRLTLVGVKGTSPTTPCHGAPPPWTPVLPTPVGLGFASVLGLISHRPLSEAEISPFPRREGGQGFRSEKTVLPPLPV